MFVWKLEVSRVWIGRVFVYRVGKEPVQPLGRRMSMVPTTALCRIHRVERLMPNVYLTASGEYECMPGAICPMPQRLGPVEPLLQAKSKAVPTKAKSPGVPVAAAVPRMARGSAASASRSAIPAQPDSPRRIHKRKQEEVSESVYFEACGNPDVKGPAYCKYPVGLYSRQAQLCTDPKFLSMFQTVHELDVDHLFGRVMLPAWKHSGQSPLVQDAVRDTPQHRAMVNTALAHLDGAQSLGFRSAGLGFHCRDGTHVSVAFTEDLARILSEKGFDVSLFHLSADLWQPSCKAGKCGVCAGALANS